MRASGAVERGVGDVAIDGCDHGLRSPRFSHSPSNARIERRRGAASARMNHQAAAMTAHPDNNGTVAHAGPPSRAVPAIRASTSPRGWLRAACTRGWVIPESGTLARRDQQEPAWPANVPELTYTNRAATGPCVNSPVRRGGSDAVSATDTRNSNTKESPVVEVATSRSVRPRWTANATPVGGAATTILNCSRDFMPPHAAHHLPLGPAARGSNTSRTARAHGWIFPWSTIEAATEQCQHD